MTEQHLKRGVLLLLLLLLLLQLEQLLWTESTCHLQLLLLPEDTHNNNSITDDVRAGWDWEGEPDKCLLDDVLLLLLCEHLLLALLVKLLQTRRLHNLTEHLARHRARPLHS